MFLTENVNYSDSILFLLSARMTLKESIELSDVDGKDQLTNFIVNEASDYEIMSLLVDGVLPKEKYDHVSEIMLFSKFKDMIVENVDMLSESIDPEIINDVLFEVNSLGSEQTSINNFIQELDPREFISKTKERFKSDDKPKPKKRPKSDLEKDTSKETVPILRKPIKKASPLPTRLQAKRKEAEENKLNKTDELTRTADENKTLMDKLRDAADKGKNIWSGLNKAQKAKGLGATALTVLAIYSAYKAYKRFFSKAAKSCSGLSGSEKTKCMKDYKIQGYQAQIRELQNGVNACKNSKDPVKCKAILKIKIAKIKEKIAEVK